MKRPWSKECPIDKSFYKSSPGLGLFGQMHHDLLRWVWGPVLGPFPQKMSGGGWWGGKSGFGGSRGAGPKRKLYLGGTPWWRWGQMDCRQPHLELRFSYKWVLCPPAQDGASNPTEILLVWISNSLGASKRSGKSKCRKPLPPPSESWHVAAQPPAPPPRPAQHFTWRLAGGKGWRESLQKGLFNR